MIQLPPPEWYDRRKPVTVDLGRIKVTLPGTPKKPKR